MNYYKSKDFMSRVEDVLRQINRANIAQIIDENGMAEYLPYLYGDIPYLDAEGEAKWNEKRLQAFEKEEEWKRQGIDVNAVENYYYYLCGLETIAASAMRAEEEGFRSSRESFVLKYIGNMAISAYEQVCYITGTTIDKDIAWYVPEKKAEAIRTTVAGNIQESVNDWWEARGYKAPYKEKTNGHTKITVKYPIKKIERINEKYIVLLKIPRVELGVEELNNIFCYDEKGKMCWRISNKLPSNIVGKGQIPYVAIQVIDGKLYATDFWGRKFNVDVENGELIDVKIVH